MHTVKILTGAVGCAVALLTNEVIAGPESLSQEGKAVVPIASTPAEVCDWTGFYIGANAGATWNHYDLGSYDVDVDQQPILFPPVTFTIPSAEFDSNVEPLGGVQIGFDKQWGHFVVGVEGDFQATGGSQSRTFIPSTISQSAFPVYGSDTDLVSVRTVETTWLASARGRVGLAYGCFLFYATGGAAFADIDVVAKDTASSTFFIITFPVDSQTDVNRSSDQRTRIGWAAGGGMEWMIRQAFSLALEYRHSDFGDETYHFSSPSGAAFPGSVRLNVDSDQVLLKVNVNLSSLLGVGH